MTPAAPPSPWPERWQRFSRSALRAFHTYASWLVGISWKRFFVLAVLLIIAAEILQSLPPFSWTVTETITEPKRRAAAAPTPPAPPRQPTFEVRKPRTDPSQPEGLDISIDERGIRISPRTPTAPAAGASAASAASAASTASGASRASAASAAASSGTGSFIGDIVEGARDGWKDGARPAPAASAPPPLTIVLPPGTVDSDAVRAAVESARDTLQEAIDKQRELAEASREAADAAREVAAESSTSGSNLTKRTRRVRWGDFLTDLALLWIVASIIVKATYKGRIQAEAKAAAATETAEAESLKRQVVEARMAAMQAQVEPHFLFNTLASIDHLIETDPPRASLMQKNLIALLRASMPTLREASGNGGNGLRDLGRELAVIRPYLEILKVRMEERLNTQVQVPDGLLSAEIPPMMLQTLVENAIKHGLEPKAEGGTLTVKAEIVHGKLALSVADTGLGFGRAATAGTGVGLANIRERLQLLYGGQAALTIAENPGGGTVATIAVPYRSVGAQAGAAA